MVRITKSSLTLCALLFTLPFTPLTQASEQAGASAVNKAHTNKAKNHNTKHKEPALSKPHSTTAKSSKTTKPSKSTKSHTASTSKKTVSSSNKKTVSSTKYKKSSVTPSRTVSLNGKAHNHKLDQLVNSVSRAEDTVMTEKCTKRRGHKKQCVAVSGPKATTIAQLHKARVQTAKQTAMNKLMDQLGKPYRWGGSSPRTGFDCSGLIYYAYKDLVNFRIPRTANEMYHLRDASPVDRGELARGDLVFFRTRGRGAADHVGVYVGGGKFIQSPRTGRDIQITSLSNDYWQRHYVGARRVVKSNTVR